jgi:7-keto-8-aminopelargonate synthetase-like enzyme
VAALKALELVSKSSDLRDRLHANAKTLRAGLEKAGFKVKPGQHPILPVMLGDAALASKMADKLLEKGIYVIGFSYPVVPQGGRGFAFRFRQHCGRPARPGVAAFGGRQDWASSDPGCFRCHEESD